MILPKPPPSPSPSQPSGPPPPPADAGAPTAGPTPAELQVLQQQIARLTDLAARAQADLQNYKIRAEREAEELRKFAVVPFLLELLPVRDDLARAAAHVPGDDGVRKILGKLDAMLREVGLRKIETLGMHADPRKHEVLATGSGAEGMIVAVHEEGYEFQGRVLRPAKVLVGSGKDADAPPRESTQPTQGPTTANPPPSSGAPQP